MSLRTGSLRVNGYYGRGPQYCPRLIYAGVADLCSQINLWVGTQPIQLLWVQRMNHLTDGERQACPDERFAWESPCMAFLQTTWTLENFWAYLEFFLRQEDGYGPMRLVSRCPESSSDQKPAPGLA